MLTLPTMMTSRTHCQDTGNKRVDSLGYTKSHGGAIKSSCESIVTTMNKKHEHKPKKTTSHDNTKSNSKKSAQMDRQTKSDTSVVSKKPRKRIDTFSHLIYENASKILLHLKGELSSSELPPFSDDLERRRSYSLAFGAKRYEKVLEDVLLDSYFFSSYFKFETNHKHRVMVLLLDYQQNNFFFGNERKKTTLIEDDMLPDIKDIQEALVAHRTKLRAALARCRVRDCAISVEALLPKEEQEKIKYAASQPVYARINTLKTNVDEICEALKNDGFEEVETLPSDENNNLARMSFCKDEHFNCLLVFSPEAKFDLHNHSLVANGHLVIQDKSTIISVEVVRQIVNEMSTHKEKASILLPGNDVKNFLGEGDDIMQTHLESGNVTSYLSSIIHPDRKIFAFGATPQTREKLADKMEVMAAHNVCILEEHFLDALPTDERFRKVKIVVVNAQCSKSGIVNPVDFILQEGVSSSIKELSQGGLDTSKIRGLAFQHLSLLRHAMKFPQIQAIVYMTRSVSEFENLDVVKKAMQEINEDLNANKAGSFEIVQALPPLVQTLKDLVLPPNIVEDEAYRKDEKYIRMAPSSAMNGGFVTLIKKQKQVETAQEVLERAAKKGLMKPGKTKTPRAPVEKKHVHGHGAPTGAMAKLSVKAEPAAVISDTEADQHEPTATKISKPKSWHGSNEDLAAKPSKTKVKKKGSERNFKF